MLTENQTSKAKIGLIGASGRMGKLIAQELNHHSQDFTLALGFSRNPETVSQFPLTNDMENFTQGSDYIIDFSHPEVLLSALRTMLSRPRPLIIGTSGLEARSEIQDLLRQLAIHVPIIIASNTSLGAQLQIYLSRILGQKLDSGFDIDIIEKHHHHKVDAPSGTAQALFHAIQEGKKTGQDLDYVLDYPASPQRLPQSVACHVVRSGNIFGEHEVIFTSGSEMISVKHVAFNREVFAQGVLRALRWLHQQQPQAGIYNMANVLGLTL